MDKSTLSQYGWLIITAVILVTMIAIAIPFADDIAEAIRGIPDQIENGGEADTTPHEHTYINEVSKSRYLVSDATCVSPALYYKSCTCGEAGTETFEYGFANATAHVGEQDTEYTFIDTTEHSKKTVCSSCDAVITNTTEEHTLEGETCTLCEGNVHIHDYSIRSTDAAFLSSEATCVTPAAYYVSCSCGAKGTEIFTDGEALGHRYVEEYNEEYFKSEATCTEPAEYYKSCDVCGAAGTETFRYGEALGHTYDVQLATEEYLATEATCTKTATYYYSCTCGGKGEDTFEHGTVDASNHEGETRTEYVSASITTHNKITVCTSCNAMVTSVSEAHTDNGEEICTYCGQDLHVHEYTEQVSEAAYLKSEAHCASPALYYYSCVCGQAGTESYEVGEADTTVHIDYTITGYVPAGNELHTVFGTCNNCGYVVTGGAEPHILASDSHICLLCSRHVYEYSDEQVTSDEALVTAANCKNPAKYAYLCSCGVKTDRYFEYGEINANNHTGRVSYSYTYEDETNHRKNTVCNSCMEIKSYVLEAHDEGGYENCTVCGGGAHAECTTFTDVVSDTYIKSAATCQSPAIYYVSCTVCGKAGTDTFEDGDVVEHSYTAQTSTEDYLATAADCQNAATYYYSCSVCGLKGTETYEYGTVADHVYNQKVATAAYRKSAATCTAKAVYYYSCVCGAKGSITFTDGGTIAHTYNQTVATEEYIATKATCTAPATYYYSCSCGAKGTATFESGELADHVYDQEVATATYLVSKATCQSPAIYTYSCACGEAGAETFEYGDVSGHTYIEKVAAEYLKSVATCQSKPTYYKSCSVCGQKGAGSFINQNGIIDPNNHTSLEAPEYTYIDNETHIKTVSCSSCGVITSIVEEGHTDDGTGTETCKYCQGNIHVCAYTKQVVNNAYLATDATCIAPATYYYSCSCGIVGTETFESGETNAQNHTGIGGISYIEATNTYHLIGYSCDSCGVEIIKTVTGEHVGVTSTFHICTICMQHVSDDAVQTPTDEYLVTPATCSSPAKYYYVCSCGKKSTNTYEYGSTDNSIHGEYIGISFCNLTYSRYVLHNDSQHRLETACNYCNETISIDAYEAHDEGGYENCGICGGGDHTHEFVIKKPYVQYQASKGTCQSPITYYYLCACGEVGTETYNDGTYGSHSYTEKIETEAYLKQEATCTSYGKYYYACSTCGGKGTSYYTTDKLDHVYDQQVTTTYYRESAATCTSPAVYYYSCVCGAKTYTSTFTHGTTIAHTYIESATSSHLKSEATCTSPAIYYKSCSKCKENGTDTFEYGKALGHTLNDMYVCLRCSIQFAGLYETGTQNIIYTWDELISLGILENTEYGLYGPLNNVNQLCGDLVISNTISQIASISRAKQLTKVVIPGSVESTGCFGDCDKLKEVIISQGVKSISEQAFMCCYSLNSIIIPDSIVNIEKEAFLSCYSLRSITIPQNTNNIGSFAFLYCYRLVEVINKSSLDIVVGTEDYGSVAYYAIEVHNGSSKIDKLNDYLFYRYNGTEYLLGYIGEETNLVLPSKNIYSSYEIHNYAFYTPYYWICDYETGEFVGVDYLLPTINSIVIPSTVSKIGSNAFESCMELTNVSIPEGVKSIGDQAFYNCTALKTVTLANGITSIGKEAFEDCDSLTRITLPESLTLIGKNSFAKCDSLKIVDVLNYKLSFEETWAFYKCSSLETINYSGEINYWKYVVYGSDALIDSSENYTIICEDGTIAKDGTVSKK